MHYARFLPTICLLLTLGAAALQAQSTGQLTGTVSMRETGGPLGGANVLIVELGRSTLSEDDGTYSFDRVPQGRYHVIAHLDSVFHEAAKIIDVQPGGAATADFSLGLTSQKYEITVTAAAKEQTTFESFSDVNSYDAYDLTYTPSVSLGEALDQKVGTGIAKRSFGPGSSRPIIRGFDGDRVLIMEDGIRTGTLSSQSGDHGEVMNPAQLERLEIVKGPATLLYSGNAIGGTVNAISRHHELHRHPHEGLRGYLSGSAGTTNALAGGSAGFEYGIGKFMLWGSGGGVRSGDYTAPQVGEIFNSRARNSNGGGGFGWFGDKAFVSFDAKVNRGAYGVPFANVFHSHSHEHEGDDHDEEEGEDHDEDEDHDEEGEEHDHEEELERVSLETRRESYRIDWGLNKLGSVIDNFEMKLNYTNWEHDEVEHLTDGDSELATAFKNQQFVYRGVFEQAKRGALSGQFGVWGISRDYSAAGEEALSPPVDQNGFALFALEEVDLERVKFQFGGRVETQRYEPAYAERSSEHEHAGEEEEEDHDEDEEDHDHEAVPDAVKRTFTGGSAAAGVHADLWQGGAFVANYAHSYRAPSLEELYNYGPHIGNLAFE
ncbi:MAG: TonB-dependent receptor, partial [Acidobacteria bacterium]|nr:TonB-dependent receptor [Acidobacteriota bacterium]